jgi:hypothetical protein
MSVAQVLIEVLVGAGVLVAIVALIRRYSHPDVIDDSGKIRD